MNDKLKSHIKIWIVVFTVVAVWLLGCTQSIGRGIQIESGAISGALR